MQDEKSQLQNRERAMPRFAVRLFERRSPSSRRSSPPRARRRSAPASARRRSGRNNFQEGVKDHRINLLVHNLDEILLGELDELTSALQDDEKRRRLEEKAVA